MRYTTKRFEHYDVCDRDADDANDKLGKLEDIEEELGIDLTVFFKAMKQKTLFVKTEIDVRETIEEGQGWGMKSFIYESGEPLIFADILYPSEITKEEWFTPVRLKPSDYGVTWSLVKEELL